MKFVTFAALSALALTTCSAPGAEPSSTPTQEPTALTSSSTLTVVTNSSFELPEELIDRFAEESGLEVSYVQPGDSGTLTNQLILTKDSPLGDVVFGIDNTHASRAWEAGVLSDYHTEALPQASVQFDARGLTPIDFSDVCINADTEWFDDAGLPLPTTLDDLVKPEYRDLLVVTDPTASTPGLSFLIATVGAKGDGWADYWQELKDNGVKVAPGWTEAYYGDFSAADGQGPRPLVLSYASSPAYAPTTVALLGTCFRQIEYAGVIDGAQNEEGARAFIDFLLSPDVQAAIPESMYMHPVVGDTELPAEWMEHAPLATSPIDVSSEDIDAHREEWIREWAEVMA